MFVLKIVS